MNAHLSNKKKSKLSPNDKILKSFYSKQKSKSEYSPNAYRSISKQQIKHQIKKVVYNCKQDQRFSLSRNLDYRDSHLQRQEGPATNIRTSLTPKSFNYPKKASERQVHSTKAADAKGKELFNSSGRYDLKQLFDRKRQQEQGQRINSEIREPREPRDTREPKQVRESRDRDRFSSGQRKNNYVTEARMNEQTTIKISERDHEDGFNVRAYLTPDEYSKFGDRFPEKFKRIGLLGRGGFSVVWLGIHRSSKRKVAVKQILTKNPHETHLKQIWFGSYFFEKGGEPREQFEHHMGINNICKLYSHEIRTIDSWLYYQVCDESLGSSLFELRGDGVAGERNYKIEYKQLIYRMREDHMELKILVIEVAKALMLINSHNIVHSDLKTENILLRTRRRQQLQQGLNYIKGVKLIDFGSSFLFTNLKQFSMATPQYMPPEILNYILFQNKLEYDEVMLQKMEKYKNPWVIDVWSLGCIVLEIVSGVPLWMSIQTKIDGVSGRVTGLYAVKNRVFAKIIQKQIDVANNIDYHLDHHNYSGIRIREDMRNVLKQMLSLNPDERISPHQILQEFGVDCQPERIPSY